MNSSGRFFSFDGIDGAGKSTQIEMFCRWLASLGHDVLVCRDPGSTELGEAVRQILLGATYPIAIRTEMLLYMACRAQLVAEVIRPAVQAGRTVVSDRFLLANVVYQGCAGNLPTELVWSVGEVATEGLQPDLTLVLDLPVDVALSRLPPERDRMEQRDANYFHAVRQGFLDQARLAPERIRVIDATRSVAEIAADIQQAAGAALRVS